MCQLDKAKGIDIGDTYITDKSCVNAIAYDRQKEQDEIVKQSHFISVISDSSTDVSSKELKLGWWLFWWRYKMYISHQ